MEADAVYDGSRPFPPAPLARRDWSYITVRPGGRGDDDDEPFGG
ncbi:MAG: hypothetical protein R3C44_12340 [Chloroflexota bacterium]